MKHSLSNIPLIVLVLFSTAGSAQEQKQKSVFLKGYVKDLQSVSFADRADSLVTSNLIHNRINFKWNFAPHFYTRIELRNRIFYGEQVKLLPSFGKMLSHDAGYFDLTALLVDQKSLVVIAALDRLLLNYTSHKLSITAGRQRINWGVNTVWNPNDLFNAFNFLDFDYEERPGIDAIRIQYFPAFLSAMEIAFKPSRKKNQSIAAALIKINKWKYDFQFTGGLYAEDITLGAGWAGNIKQAGFKGEASYFRNKKDLRKNISQFTGSVMIDYSFKDSWYVSASVLYIKNPVKTNPALVNLYASGLSVKSLMPFNWSFYTGVMKSFTPITSGNMAVVYSPADNSLILFPTLTYNAHENLDLDLTAQSYFTDQPGKFKTAGNSIYFRIRWSF